MECKRLALGAIFVVATGSVGVVDRSIKHSVVGDCKKQTAILFLLFYILIV